MKSINRLFLSIVSLSFFLISCGSGSSYDLDDGLYAEINTSRGTIVARLAFQKAPLTVINFAGLAEGKIKSGRGEGTKYYDGLTFHRVVKDPPFVVQGGCPNGDGTGNPGYTFPDEFHPDLRHDGPGVLSMANSGPDSNGSQFFITLAAQPHLDDRHSVFGKVVIGLDVVEKIEEGDAIKSVRIIRVGEKAESFQTDQSAFNAELKKAEEDRGREAAARREESLEKIKENWPGAEEGESGLKYVIEKAGSGKKIDQGDTVTLHYKAMFTDKSVFDDSRKRDAAMTFVYGQDRLFPSWELTIGKMRVGEVRTVISPPELAFGAAGSPDGFIPPDSYLVFEFEILSAE